MRHRFTYLLLFIGLFIGFAYAYATPIYEYDTPAPQGFRSHKILSAGTLYQGTTYVPFDDAAPSDYSEVGASYSPNRAPGGPRRAFDTGAETGRDEQYPVGEPWILLLFAATFAGVMALRRKNSTQ